MSSNTAAPTPALQELDVAALDFDPHNPRFPHEIAAGPEADLISRFVRDERLLEVLTSIADQGYFSGEPLLVVAHGARFQVVEGNRRLAALKLLNGLAPVPPGRFSVEEAIAQARNRPARVPCLVFQGADQIMRYLGFRHITGIKSWSSLQKARYLKQMRDRFYQGLDGREQLKALAREIGSRADYVGSMLAALNLYEVAERENFYGVPGLQPESIEFSVLTTALSYTSIADFVGLEDRQDSEGAQLQPAHLQHLLTWLFAAPNNQRTVLGDSRNLKQLAAVVASPSAVRMLIDTGSLETAHQLSRGPAVALSLALKSVERKLKDMWEWLPQVDTPEPGDEELAESIRKRALSIRDAIKTRRAAADDE